jgi:hypothetical protein
MGAYLLTIILHSKDNGPSPDLSHNSFRNQTTCSFKYKYKKHGMYIMNTRNEHKICNKVLSVGRLVYFVVVVGCCSNRSCGSFSRLVLLFCRVCVSMLLFVVLSFLCCCCCCCFSDAVAPVQDFSRFVARVCVSLCCCFCFVVILVAVVVLLNLLLLFKINLRLF